MAWMRRWHGLVAASPGSYRALGDGDRLVIANRVDHRMGAGSLPTAFSPPASTPIGNYVTADVKFIEIAEVELTHRRIAAYRQTLCAGASDELLKVGELK